MATSVNPIPSNAQMVPVITGSVGVDPNLPDRISPLDTDLLNNKQILPALNYTNLDFSSIKLQLLNLLKSNASTFGYSNREFSDSNTAGMFLNIVAYTGQLLSYHMDSMVNELYLDTAQTPWATFKLLNLFGYKPTRPIPGMIFLSVTRNPSTNFNSNVKTIENSSEILFSSSLNRKRFTFGTETYEIFPIIQDPINGTVTPDLLGDFVIPAYVSSGPGNPDVSYANLQNNTYFCFGMTGKTVIEDFISNGTSNQIISLNQGPVNNSKITVQVEDITKPKITGNSIYNTWTELTYLSLAGFRTGTIVNTARDGQTPYLISTFKLSEKSVSLNKQDLLTVGTVMSLNYDNTLDVSKYQDFFDLSVPFQTAILINTQSEKRSDPGYVDVLLYHPSYIYGEAPDTSTTLDITSSLINYVFSESGDKIYWSPGDILYLMDSSKTVSINNVLYHVPQIISDTQIELASRIYEDATQLRLNPALKIAVGRALTPTTMAFGISADVSTSITSDNIYEVNWDGNFFANVKFGDGVFGNIPPIDSAIKIIYRVNDSQTTGDIISAGRANQTVSVGSVDLFLRNDYDSSPALIGETSQAAKEIATRFFASQDRAVTGSDYTILTKKYNSNYKISTTLSKADADGSVIRLYLLAHRTGGSSEKLDFLTMVEKLQLREYLNNYKCLGTSLELVDGVIRPLDLRIDVRVKPGYLSGQVKNDVQTTVYSFFDFRNAEMGVGFSASDFIKVVSSVAGLDTCDFYFGGIPLLNFGDGTKISIGSKVYQQIKDIPSYSESPSSFPSLGSSTVVTLDSVTDALQPYEILVLGNFTLNMASR